MKKKTLIVICYVILPWIYGEFNQLISRQAEVLSRDLSHPILLQTAFPIFYGFNLVLFLCLLSYLYIKILKEVTHHCLASILGVSVYPLSYYFVFLLSYVGAGVSPITNIVMKTTPFLYYDRLSLPILLAISLMAIVINWLVKKGHFRDYINSNHMS